MKAPPLWEEPPREQAPCLLGGFTLGGVSTAPLSCGSFPEGSEHGAGRGQKQGAEQPALTTGHGPAKPPGRAARTQEALLIDNDGVILRGLGQTEELAPGGTDRQTQSIV